MMGEREQRHFRRRMARSSMGTCSPPADARPIRRPGFASPCSQETRRAEEASRCMAVLALTLSLIPSVETALALVALLLACAGATLVLKPLDSLARRFSLLLAVGAAALAARVLPGSQSAGVVAVQARTLGLQPMLLFSFCQNYAVRRAPVGAPPLVKWTRVARGAAEAALLLAARQVLAAWLSAAR